MERGLSRAPRETAIETRFAWVAEQFPSRSCQAKLQISDAFKITVAKYLSEKRVVGRSYFRPLTSIQKFRNFNSINKNGYATRLDQRQHGKIVRSPFYTKNCICTLVKLLNAVSNRAMKKDFPLSLYQCRALLWWTKLIACLLLAKLIAPCFEKNIADGPKIFSPFIYSNTGTGWGLGTLVSIHEALLGIVFKKIFCG